MENPSNTTNQNCDHVWLGIGLWDGKTGDGKPTGGIVFQCSKCGDKVYSEEKVREKGGIIDWENSKIKAAGRK